MLEIREAKEDQFNDIWHIFQEVVKEGDSYPYLPNISFEEAQKAWFAPNAKVYIAYLGDKPVATRYIVPNKAGLGSHVANTGVMIAKSYRGQSIGKQMMQFAISKCKELGYKAIQLNLVVVTNKASIKICQDHGFQIIGTLPNAFHFKQQYYIDAYVMYKLLD